MIDRNELAGRTVRAFLGQRIDCAQCHNHPFADWKQAQFQGLAACFGQAQVSTIYQDKNQYKVVMEAAPEYWQSPSTLDSIYVLSPTKGQVPLSAFVHV